MKREHIMAHMEGVKTNMNQNLIFHRHLGNIDKAPDYCLQNNDEYVTVGMYETLDNPIPAGAEIKPSTEYYKGSHVITGFYYVVKSKAFVDSISEYIIQIEVRGIIAKEVQKESPCTIVYSGDIDCKLTKLYLSGAIEWDEYVNVIIENC